MPAPRVISEEVAFLMNTALRGVIQGGTARGAQVLNRQDIAGKTGTTNNQLDAWFAGYNPDLVVTTWVGFDNPSPLHEYASRLSLPLWIDFMRTALKDKPEQELKIPDHIVSKQIHPKTGLLDTSNSASSIQEYFHEDSVPDEETSSTHSSKDTNAPTRQDQHIQQDYLF